MTIKEVEERTGVSRANVRFYEKEGLLCPKREENGYRTYSSQDVEELEKLKLLRALGVSLEEIRRIQKGESSLCDALSERQIRIGQEIRYLQNAGAVCGQMCREQVDYATLNAAHYLQELEKPRLPASDVIPSVMAPWRRFFARALDYSIYLTLFYGILALTTHVNLLSDSPLLKLAGAVAAVVLMLALEPVMLHFFGTTPGKWVLGLSVTSLDGDRLTWDAAWDRTWEMFSQGQGFNIPFWRVYRQWKSYADCTEGRELSWEDNSVLVLRDRKGWRIAAYVLACVLLIAAEVGAICLQWVPDHRGNLDVADFAKNYNQIQKLNDSEYTMKLNNQGQWEERYVNSMGLDLMEDPELEYQYYVEDGVLKGISFTVERDGESVVDYLRQRVICIRAFVRAQRGLIAFGDETPALIEKLQNAPLETWEMEANGVKVKNQVTYSGYTYAESLGTLFYIDDQPRSFQMTFSMELAE